MWRGAEIVLEMCAESQAAQDYVATHDNPLWGVQRLARGDLVGLLSFSGELRCASVVHMGASNGEVVLHVYGLGDVPIQLPSCRVFPNDDYLAPPLVPSPSSSSTCSTSSMSPIPPSDIAALRGSLFADRRPLHRIRAVRAPQLPSAIPTLLHSAIQVAGDDAACVEADLLEFLPLEEVLPCVQAIIDMDGKCFK